MARGRHSLMFQVSPAYERERPALIAELLRYAEDGRRELSFLVDADSGEIIDRQEGEVDEVSPDWEKVKPGQRVVALHSHPDPGGPGGEDWEVLGVQFQVGRLEVVDVVATHIVEKPEPWQFQEAISQAAQLRSQLTDKWVSPIRSLFDRALNAVRKDPDFAAQDKAAHVDETNKRLLRQPYFKDFRIRKEAHFA